MPGMPGMPTPTPFLNWIGAARGHVETGIFLLFFFWGGFVRTKNKNTHLDSLPTQAIEA